MSLFDGDDSWKKHGPGTCEWDVMFGTNHTGLFPDKEVYILPKPEEDIQKWRFVHTGGGHYEGTFIDAKMIDMLKALNKSNCEYIFKIYETDTWYRCVKDPDFTFSGCGTAVKLTLIKTPSDSKIWELYDRDIAFYYLKNKGVKIKMRWKYPILEPMELEKILHLGNSNMKLEKIIDLLQRQIPLIRDEFAEADEMYREFWSIRKFLIRKTIDDEQALDEFIRMAERVQELVDQIDN